MTEPTSRSIPALAAYIDRIGAEELNFRRFMVREYAGRSGYYTETAIIKLREDGSIQCSRKEYEPTEAEAVAIKEALQAANFPRAIHARDASQLREMLGRDALLYEFWDRTSNDLVMVQQRVNFDNGTKAYMPWTFFSDGQWRRMEPDGDLPFWKPRTARNLPRIMIHEGAKAAAFIDDLVNNRQAELANHPWREDLIRYEHWGMIGGALAPHRAKYSELHKESPREVVYVCDNDQEGKNVLQVFSRHYRKPLKGIIFSTEFPDHWDMADPIPKKLFNGSYYHGPTFRRLLKFATWATSKLPNPAGKGPQITVLTNEFKSEWLHSVTPEAYIHIDWPNQILTASEFNDMVAPFSDSANTALLVQKDAAIKHTHLAYNPAHSKGIYHDEKGSYINTHMASEIKPITGDPTPWLEFIDHLCPEEGDKKELLRWCATLIARPSIRMHYGILAISETQGVGKGTLGEKVLAPLVGRENVSFPSEAEIVDSDYNYWLSHKRLGIVHEIYAGNSSKPYNKLKSAITDQQVSVQKKYMANYNIENWIHIYACSNSRRALKLSIDDRRWFVPRIVEARRDTGYWKQFNTWLELEGGLGIIMHWAHEWLKTNEPVNTGDAAPDSSLKREVIEEGLSPGQELVLRALTSVRQRLEDLDRNPQLKKDWEQNKFLVNGDVFVTDRMLVELIKQQLYDGRQNDRLERPYTVRKLAKMAGWYAGSKRINIGRWGQQNFNGRIICSSGALIDFPNIAEYMPLTLDQLVTL